jgi:hypothetical protein
MVAARLEREIAEMYFWGQKAPAGAPSSPAAREECFCDKDMNLKIGGF